MLSNFVQDSESILYENLFFWLTLGKYDTALYAKFRNYQHEEFVIVGEQWKDRITYIENVISLQNQRFIREYKQESYFSRNTFFSVKFRIFFVIYTTPATGRLLGLGIRIITPENSSIELAMTPEDRLQKSMYLISRGLLRSYHHRIDQLECPIPI